MKDLMKDYVANVTPNKKINGIVYFSKNAFDENGEINQIIEDIFNTIEALNSVSIQSKSLSELKNNFKSSAKNALKEAIFNSMAVQIEEFFKSRVSKNPTQKENKKLDLNIHKSFKNIGKSSIYYDFDVSDVVDFEKFKLEKSYSPSLTYGMTANCSDKIGTKSTRLVGVDEDKLKHLIDISKEIDVYTSSVNSLENEMSVVYPDEHAPCNKEFIKNYILNKHKDSSSYNFEQNPIDINISEKTVDLKNSLGNQIEMPPNDVACEKYVTKNSILNKIELDLIKEKDNKRKILNKSSKKVSKSKTTKTNKKEKRKQ